MIDERKLHKAFTRRVLERKKFCQPNIEVENNTLIQPNIASNICAYLVNNDEVIIQTRKQQKWQDRWKNRIEICVQMERNLDCPGILFTIINLSIILLTIIFIFRTIGNCKYYFYISSYY